MPPRGPHLRSSSLSCRGCWWQQLSAESCGNDSAEDSWLAQSLAPSGGSYPMAGYWSQQYQGLALLPPAGTRVKGYLLQSSLGVR